MIHTILGARGFIGGRLAQRLHSAGLECFAPDRGDERVFSGTPLGIVFYCVGMTADYLSNPGATVEAHVGLLSRLLKTGAFSRLIYLSSTRLYDSNPSTVAKESDPLALASSNPRHLYDLTKALGENLSLTASGGRGSVARLSCVYDAAPGAPGFMSELITQLRANQDVHIDSSPGIVRDYIALDDVVEALLAIANHRESGIFNVASGENTSNADIAAFVNRSGRSLRFSGSGP
ncbi:MAG TPA: SDR family oxidoreductase, partial [Burkholderiales bacterium]|nr:SDR family oxidoreductase [Burkholderiales bacterium]